MKFYTEEAAQELADEKGRAVCAWIPCMGGQPITGLGDNKWVVDPRGKVSEYEDHTGRHSITRVFRPRKGSKRA